MTPQTGRAMLMDLLKGEVRAGDVRRAVETIEAEAQATLRADLIERVERLPVNLEYESSWQDEQAMYECVSKAEVLALLRDDKEERT